jgi:hypothetical protein
MAALPTIHDVTGRRLVSSIYSWDIYVYNRQRMVARNRNTIWPPPPQLPLHRRAAPSTNSNGTQSAHKGKLGGGRSRFYSYVYGRSICWKKPIRCCFKMWLIYIARDPTPCIECAVWLRDCCNHLQLTQQALPGIRSMWQDSQYILEQASSLLI